MFFDFMSYVAQQLGQHEASGRSLVDARVFLKKAVLGCSQNFKLCVKSSRLGMYAIVNESYPAPRYVKDPDSDYQAQKSIAWTSNMMDQEDAPDPTQVKESIGGEYDERVHESECIIYAERRD